MKRLIPLLTLALLVSVPLLAQQQKKERPLVFTPQWTAQSQFAGYYVAQEKGFYADEGIEVSIVHPNATQSTEQRIRANATQVTTLQLAQAMQIIDGGLPLVNILQTSMNSGMVVVSRRGVSPMEQKGSKVAIWAAGFTQLVEAVVAEAGLDFDWVRAASSVSLFIAGAVDASVGMSYNEYYPILQAGFIIDENSVYRFSDHGYNIQEDGVYVTREFYENNREKAEKFARASRRGWEYTAAHPEEALDIVMKYVRRNHIATNRIIQQLQLDEILHQQLDPDTGERAFRIRPEMVQQASQMMLNAGIIGHPVDYEQLCR